MVYNYLDVIKQRTVYFDGGYGTLFQQMGLKPGEACEVWNITEPEKIKYVHRAYINAGADIIKTNTFGANSLKFPKSAQYSYDELIRTAVNNAKEVVGTQNKECYIAFDVGPTGKLLKPLGDLEFEDAVSIFVKILAFFTVNIFKFTALFLVLSISISE